MYIIYIILLLFRFNAHAGELAGFIAVEGREFLNPPLYDQQKSNDNLSVVLEPEYYHISKNQNHTFVIKPFFRSDNDDDNREHYDIRELNWQYRQDNFELVFGIDKVFWGVTESNHLVDIINQTDNVENVDGEDKLGQPMLQLSFSKDYGDFSFFYLPYYRERTFHSSSGRLRSQIPVLEDETLYESSHKEKHQDFAIRYEHIIGDIDLGISYFSGTSREANLTLSTDINGNPSFKPFYNIINQFGIDLQYTQEEILWKLEAISREGHGRNFAAYTAGIEYTFYNVFNNIDLGTLIEHQFDDRDDNAPLISNQNNVFSGLRLSFNDAYNSELLAGIITDSSSEVTSYFTEFSRRISNNWKIEFDGRIFISKEIQIYQDDFIQLRLSRFF